MWDLMGPSEIGYGMVGCGMVVEWFVELVMDIAFFLYKSLPGYGLLCFKTLICVVMQMLEITHF